MGSTVRNDCPRCTAGNPGRNGANSICGLPLHVPQRIDSLTFRKRSCNSGTGYIVVLGRKTPCRGLQLAHHQVTDADSSPVEVTVVRQVRAAQLAAATESAGPRLACRSCRSRARRPLPADPLRWRALTGFRKRIRVARKHPTRVDRARACGGWAGLGRLRRRRRALCLLPPRLQ
jgi:hypothetical protein